MLTAGQPAPEFALTNQRDEGRSLAALRGHRVLVYIYNKISPQDTPTRLLEALAG